MPRYAKGRKAVAISDRSGFRVPYNNLRTEWTGLRVEPEEYEPKNPQLTPPKNIIDATALFKPRPDNDPENIRIDLAFDWFNNNVTTSLDSTLYKKPNLPSCKGNVGTVEIVIPTVVYASYVSGTTRVGTEIPTASPVETGVSATGNVGTESIVVDYSATATGVAGTGAIGTFGETDGINLSISISGTNGTGAIGTYTVDEDHNRWGEGAWGEGAWGIDARHTQVDATGLLITGYIGTISLVIDSSPTASSSAGTGDIGTISITTTYTGWGDESWGEDTWGQ